ncbi:helix-turn-helix domain-containing protein [Algoriphagus pacificus]|uniref:Helix-turn-helix transcriptional regulator n=1 Tax=Algoriphagus pacificus TaxID=2811234 RepID=A0ABS3CIY8_9BACT|nr:helix-turn-helix transcriptional regulator [Algoriphagus pacificus]MBN7816479.1 helix-turn-helix transcriptional regulator [Algoriphagus pacificus]
MELTIKNMVCPRCISAVKSTLTDLAIEFSNVDLGKVSLTKPIDSSKEDLLSKALLSQGFELLKSEKSSLISQIKAHLIQQIHYTDKPLQTNYSTFLADQLNHEYSYLSRLFSSVEGITIEKFITRQKIEKVKELLVYDELTLSEIAFKMDYSSVAYLSSQFKKETGMTPSEFKKDSAKLRESLDRI